MEAHIDTTCPKTVIKCKYSEFGCKHEVSKLNSSLFLPSSFATRMGGKISTYIVSHHSYNNT